MRIDMKNFKVIRCRACGREFYQHNGNKKTLPSSRNSDLRFRPAKSMTCSKKCSRELKNLRVKSHREQKHKLMVQRIGRVKFDCEVIIPNV